MRVLVVAATALEGEALLAGLGSRSARRGHVCAYSVAHRHVDLLLTGVGMVATAAWCSRVLAETRYDLALNVGVCGSFDRSIALGTAVHVMSDRIAELGAEDGDRFMPIEELGLLPADGPFASGELVNPAPPANPILDRLPAVAGITVNTVHGSERSIADVVQRYHPQVESMEGAAFMYTCLIHGVRFAQVRAVSNAVERRKRAAWRMSDAVACLGATALGILETL